jgi:hypothetical protein
VVAVLLSAAFAYQVSQAGTQPLTAEQQAEFVAGCQASNSTIDCTCLLTQLQAAGYDSLNSLNSIMAEGEAAVADSRPSEMPPALLGAVRACRTG